MERCGHDLFQDFPGETVANLDKALHIMGVIHVRTSVLDMSH
jgi:hypothetical protein